MLCNLQYNAVDFAVIVPQVRRLWIETFGDDDAFISHFFSLADAEHHLHTLTADGRLVSMLFALPYRIWHSGREIPAAYIYAVATAADFAGNGCMRQLMQYVHDNLRLQGYAATFLVPSKEWLFHYYARLGYNVCAWYDDEVVERLMDIHMQCCSLVKEHFLTDEIYSFILSCAKESIASVLHSRESVALNILSCEMSGGGLYVLRDGDAVSALAFVVNSGKVPLIIAEYSKKSDARSCLFQRLCLLLNVDFIQCRRSGPLGAVPYAMAYSLNGIFPAEVSMQLLLDV